jgi:hypothetical protein
MNPPHKPAPGIIIGTFINKGEAELIEAFQQKLPVRAVAVALVEQLDDFRPDKRSAVLRVLRRKDGWPAWGCPVSRHKVDDNPERLMLYRKRDFACGRRWTVGIRKRKCRLRKVV